MKILSSFGWILLLLPLISVAGTRTALNAIDANDTETRQVSDFTGVGSAGSFDVYISFGNRENLRLEGDKDLLDKIETEVEDGILNIRYKRGLKNNSWKPGKVKVYITAKNLNYLAVSGSGNMRVDGTVKAENVQSRVSGSGSISMNLASSKYSAAISGSGKIHVSGNAKEADIAVSGSGDFEGRKLNTDSANVKVSGSGSATLEAEKSLNAVLSGSGNIRYAGNAKVNSTKSGSGRISRL